MERKPQARRGGTLHITEQTLAAFDAHLQGREKAPATVDKYLREVYGLRAHLNGACVTKAELVAYRDALHRRFAPQTVNGKLSAINAYLRCMGRPELCVRLLRVQRRAFVAESKELSQAEYRRLLMAAQQRGNERLYHVMLAICGTGIRVSELRAITVEAARRGSAAVSLKGKERVILLPRPLCKRLLGYAQSRGIRAGHIFRTRSGLPLDRSNICHDMKALCQAAGVDAGKVFPHNFRHLFARTFYAIEKDLSHLADVLGHSSIETTRIYVATSARQHEKRCGACG